MKRGNFLKSLAALIAAPSLISDKQIAPLVEEKEVNSVVEQGGKYINNCLIFKDSYSHTDIMKPYQQTGVLLFKSK